MALLMAILFVFCFLVWLVATMTAIGAAVEEEFWSFLVSFSISILSGGTCLWIIWSGIQALIVYSACGG